MHMCVSVLLFLIFTIITLGARQSAEGLRMLNSCSTTRLYAKPTMLGVPKLVAATDVSLLAPSLSA